MDIVAYGISETGARQNNEDAYFIQPDHQLYLVSDGMGGHASGEIASATTAKVLERVICNQATDIRSLYPHDVAGIEKYLVEAVELACLRVNQLATRHEELMGMGATLTLLMVVGNHGFLAHVGDSRLYVLRKGKIRQISDDHTVAEELVREGLLEPEEAQFHASANVLLRAIGPDATVSVDSLTFDINDGDLYLLCSDGLSGILTQPEELIPFLESDNLAEVPELLVKFALQNGSSDNITALVVAVTESERTKPIEQPLFDGLSREDISRILRSGSIRAINQNEPLHLAGVVVMLVSGELALPSDVTVGPKQFIGLENLLDNSPSDVIAHARENSRVMVWSLDAFEDLCSTELAIGQTIWRNIAKNLCERLSIEHGLVI